MRDVLDNLTDEARTLLKRADDLGYLVNVSTHGDILRGEAERLVLRMIPVTDEAKRRFRLAGREDRIIEVVAGMHPDEDLTPFALEAAIAEALEQHNRHLALVVT